MRFAYAILHNLLKVPFYITGLVMVPVAYRWRHVPAHEVPRWLMPWVNPEDWTDGYRGFGPERNCIPPNLAEEYPGFWGFFRYHALRNGADGMRNYDAFLCWYDHEEMKLVRLDADGSYTVHQGRLYGSWFRKVRVAGREVHIKFGWRQTPADYVAGLDHASFRWLHGAQCTWSVRIR